MSPFNILHDSLGCFESAVSMVPVANSWASEKDTDIVVSVVVTFVTLSKFRSRWGEKILCFLLMKISNNI